MLCFNCPQLNLLPEQLRKICCSDERRERERQQAEAEAATHKVANDRPNRAARRRQAKYLRTIRTTDHG